MSGYLDQQTRDQLSKTVADYALDKLSDINVLIKTIVAVVKSEKPVFTDESNR